MKVRHPALLLAVLGFAPGVAAQEPDSVPPREPFFTAADARLGVAFAVATVAAAPLDRSLAHALQDSTLQVHRVLRGTADGLRLLGFPGTVLIGSGLYVAGRLGGDEGLAAMGLHGTEAVILSYAVVWTGKGLAGRARPYVDVDDPLDFRFGRGLRGSNDFESFPSGHTAAAFALAAVVDAEWRRHWPEAPRVVGPALYGGAALVGVSRMYHNRHWASDVIAGAAIGTFAGQKVIRYHYPAGTTGSRRDLLPTALLPTGSGVAFVWILPGP